MKRHTFKLIALLLAACCGLSANASDQSAISRHCLETVRPVLRNTDGSLSPNPAFDACLSSPVILKAPTAARPQQVATVLPAAVTPAAPKLAPSDGAVPPPAPSTLISQPTKAAASIEPEFKMDPAPPLPPLPKWKASNGEWLSETLEKWAKQAEWTLVWEAKDDVQIVGTLSYEGEFLDAIRNAFRPYRATEKPLRPAAYPKQKLIVVRE